MILIKKALNDIKAYKKQFIPIALIVFWGIFIFAGINGCGYGMEYGAKKYYEKTDAADFWVMGSFRDASGICEKISEIKGVKQTEARLHIKGEDIKKSGDLDLYLVKDNKLSRNIRIKGEEFTSAEKGLWISNEYATANNYKVGDTIPVKVLDKVYEEKIRGIIQNPEYVFHLFSSEQLFPNYEGYGYAFMSWDKNPLLTENTFNEILVKSKDGTSLNVLEHQLEKNVALSKYSILSRGDMISFRLTDDKIEGMKSMSVVYPTVLLGLALFMTSISMIRLMYKQRYEIGVMQALGIKRTYIVWHFCFMAILVSLPPAILGYFLGEKIFPAYIFSMMKMYRIPNLYGMQPKIYFLVIFIVIVLSILSVIMSFKYSVKDDIALSMKGIKSKKNRKLSIESGKRWEKLSFVNKWIIKNIADHILQSMAVIFAVGGATMIMITAFNQRDGMNDIIPWYFDDINRYNSRVVLNENANVDSVNMMAKKYDAGKIMDTVIYLKNAKGNALNTLRILDDDVKGIITLRDERKRELKLSSEGVYVSKRLMDSEDINVGDKLMLKLAGGGEYIRVKVAGVCRQPINQGFFMSARAYENIGGKFKATALVTKDNVKEKAALKYGPVKQINYTDVEKEDILTVVKSVRGIENIMIMGSVLLMIIIMYNIGSLNFVENRFSFAVLKSLGFKDKILRKIYKRHMYFLVTIGLVAGVALSKPFTLKLLSSLGRSTDIMYLGKWETKLIGCIIIVITSFVINNIIALNINKINMVEELKQND